MPGRRVLVGCAGWVIPRAWAARFPGPGTHLERYGRVLPAVEIDTSFYRSHARETYARWSHAVPPAFRFAVKAPRLVTHTRRLRRATEPFRRFLGEARGLGNKLGAVLIQLPPSLRYQGRTVAAFLGSVRRVWRGGVALEPRHGSWFDGTGDRLLAGFRVARVAAHPPPAAGADLPGGWGGLVYFRLHGAPRRYYSAYSDEFLDRLADRIRGLPGRPTVWCVFDNTAAGEAVGNALGLLERLRA